MNLPTPRSPEDEFSPEPVLKFGIRPENLRIRPEREVRVRLNLNQHSLERLLTELGEAWFSTITPSTMLHRKFAPGTLPEVCWLDGGFGTVNEKHTDLLYDISKGRRMWAIQRTDDKGRKSFRLEICNGEGVAHQIRITRRSNVRAFLKWVNKYQAECQTSCPAPHSSSGLLDFMETRWREWLKRPDICRRVERTAVPAFLEAMANHPSPQQVTVLNSLVKQTSETRFESCQVNGSKITLKSPHVIFQWDSATMAEAWLIQCGCACGEELLEMYDTDNRLMASVACRGITPAMERLLPTLN
tara:strand:- start:515 stop:1417 length:903 start_codon:yes stop_codon:yes gene_type:complete